ncbi:PspC domain-containing protein [Mesobacillus harenae]|uniref:PspC domain-containing protein n=1 Tax=Mesobacillus harenae TaxID=2213203 RepID=UPI001580275F|nr:PspC domain-containing protein [Mesobacillus harenae]
MKLTRSNTNKKLAGVLGGIAESIGVNPTIVRVIFIILLFTTAFFPMTIVYFAAMFLMPKKKDVYR